MTSLRATLCLLSLVGISGFSTAPVAPCDQVAASSAALNRKIESCLPANEAALPFDAVSCQASTRSCTGADRITIAQFLGCVDRLPTCSADGSAFRAQFEACAAGAQLSAGCSL